MWCVFKQKKILLKVKWWNGVIVLERNLNLTKKKKNDLKRKKFNVPSFKWIQWTIVKGHHPHRWAKWWQSRNLNWMQEIILMLCQCQLVFSIIEENILHKLIRITSKTLNFLFPFAIRKSTLWYFTCVHPAVRLLSRLDFCEIFADFFFWENQEYFEKIEKDFCQNKIVHREYLITLNKSGCGRLAFCFELFHFECNNDVGRAVSKHFYNRTQNKRKYFSSAN